MIRLGSDKNTYFRDCQTFLESKCSWGDNIQALPHLPSYGIFKPDPCRWRLRSFCKTCFKVISSFWTNFDHSSASKSRQYFESFKILTKFQIKKSFPNLKISTKIQLQILRQTTANLDQSSASTSWPNFSFTVVTKMRVQNLYQTSASKSCLNWRQRVPQHQHQQHELFSQFNL